MKFRIALALLSFCTVNSAGLANPFQAPKFKEFTTPDIPHLHISLEDRHLEQIVTRRNEALQEHVLESSGEDFVPAIIELDGKDYRSEIRLKGDFIVHLHSAKWSYRVKIKGNNTVLGMKTFSLHHPRIRLFLHEYVILEALRYEGLIAARYQFVKVSINGTYLGIYNLEEHFESRLIEHNQRRDGPILKIDEDMLFQLINQELRRTNKDATLFTRSPIDTFQKTKIAKDPIMRAQFEKAKSLLEAFRQGKAKVAEVFDMDEFARYYAVTDVFMGKHGARWHNQRFYFNPLTSRLHPIGFDFNDDKPGLDPLSRINRGHGIFYGTNWAFDVFSRMLFTEPKFFALYIKHADRITHPGYLKRFFKHIEARTKFWESALAHEFSGTHYEEFIRFNNNFRSAYKDNQRYVREAIYAVQPVNVHVMQEDKNETEIIFENRGEFPLEIYEYQLNGTVTTLDPAILLPTFRFNHIYTPRRPSVMRFTLPVARTQPTDEFFFRYNTLNLPIPHRLTVPGISLGGVPEPGKPGTTHSFDLSHPTRAKPTNFPFMSRKKDKLVVKSGSWTIAKNLIVPANSRLIIPKGTTLNLKDGASIISHSPIDSMGTKAHPVVIESRDGTGQGVIILNANEESHWTHTAVRNLSAPRYEEWQPTGVVTFYRSPISMNEVTLSSLRGEDSLNLVNTNVDLRQVTFMNATSDALDIDFSTGHLSNLTFNRSGNDALDVFRKRANHY